MPFSTLQETDLVNRSGSFSEDGLLGSKPTPVSRQRCALEHAGFTTQGRSLRASGCCGFSPSVLERSTRMFTPVPRDFSILPVRVLRASHHACPLVEFVLRDSIFGVVWLSPS